MGSSWRTAGIARISRGRRRPGGFACGRRWALTSQDGSLLSVTVRFSALRKLRMRVRFPSLAHNKVQVRAHISVVTPGGY